MAKSVAKKSTKVAKSAKSNTKAVAPVAVKKAATPVAPVAEKATKPAKAAKKPVVVKAPNPLHAALIALMTRKDGATITDFQTIEGFNIPSMAALRIAERHGYEATASKKPGELTRYVAVKRA
jgi:hypothetical protein